MLNLSKYKHVLIPIVCTVVSFVIGYNLFPHQLHNSQSEQSYEAGIDFGYRQAILDVSKGNIGVWDDNIKIIFDTPYADTAEVISFPNPEFENMLKSLDELNE